MQWKQYERENFTPSNSWETLTGREIEKIYSSLGLSERAGNSRRNLGLFTLLAAIIISFISYMIYMFEGDEKWFSRFALFSILLGLYLIADKE
jgi:hypothetical protein